MASHNISLKHEIYQRLVEIKEENESFSDLIERLLEEGQKGTFSRLKKYFGPDTSIPEGEDLVKQKMKEVRENINQEMDLRMKKRRLDNR